VFNRAIAKKNPWIEHLEKSGFYKNVRDLLQQAKATYKPKDPQKRTQSLARQLTKLQAEMEILQNEAKARSMAPEFTQTMGKKYRDVTYDDVLKDKIARLQNEIDRIQKSLPGPI
jgi:peptidoglycan hydrolase CwlO-like protein